MARSTKKDKVQDAGSRFGGKQVSGQRIEFTFINVSPNAADIAWLLANEENAGAIVYDFLTGLADGYKLSCNFDKQSGRFNATLACSADDDPNRGLILSFRAANAYDALYGLAYSDLHKLEGEWSRQSAEPANRFG